MRLGCQCCRPMLSCSLGLVLLEVSTNICVPDGGEAWHALRSDDFSVIDLSPLSAALQDLITRCMRSDYVLRPPIEHLIDHPVVHRARNGRSALAPEDKSWCIDVLVGAGFAPAAGQTSAADRDEAIEDVGMAGMSLGEDVEMA